MDTQKSVKMSIIISKVNRDLDLCGKKIQDETIDRMTLELKTYHILLYPVDIREIELTEYNESKYGDEMHDIETWMHSDSFLQSTRRQIVYFNNNDFYDRRQCISLFQILDNEMIVYQRSGDVIKMKDDHRFFVEIVRRHFPKVELIDIIYGSVHKAC